MRLERELLEVPEDRDRRPREDTHHRARRRGCAQHAQSRRSLVQNVVRENRHQRHRSAESHIVVQRRLQAESLRPGVSRVECAHRAHHHFASQHA